MFNQVRDLILPAAEAKGWNQTSLHAALAEAGLKVSLQTVNNWWLGNSGIDPAHQPVVSKVLGVPFADLATAVAERASARAGRTPNASAA